MNPSCEKKKRDINDNSDRKSLDNLVDQLLKLQKSKEIHMESSPKTSTIKRSSSGSGPSTKKKRSKIDDKHPKITSWFKKDDKKPKPLDITVEKKDKKKFERTSSFEKYGVVIPSFEKIIADQKKFDEYKDKVRAFEAFDESVFEKVPDNDCLKEVNQFTEELLDCKHLSNGELKEAFDKHFLTLKKIMSGEKYSERHQIYHKFDVKYDYTAKDLRCSTSLVVFTQEQKDYLLDLMRIELDPEDKKTKYFFKVLLPELCLLIFMDTHNMSKRRANSYLDKRPVDV